jgi:hypothetical protein
MNTHPFFKKFALLLLFSQVFSVGCELKDDTPPIPHVTNNPLENYRSKYYGDFVFTSYHWETSMGNYYYWDTVTYTGTISGLENRDNAIQIRYRDGAATNICPGAPAYAYIHPTLQQSGILLYPEIYCGGHSSFSGAFNRLDTVDFEFGSGGNGSQGGHRVTGYRIR